MNSEENNTYRVEDGNRKAGGGRLLKRLESALHLDAIFENGIPVKYLPHMLFTVGLVIFYIGNSHYAEKTIRRIETIEQQVKDLRADYHTLKANYMVASKQSEVAKGVKGMGLVESLMPPQKIILTEED